MNFNVDDHVVELTNIDQWRHDDTFKAEVFVHDFYKRVKLIDTDTFMVMSNRQPIANYPEFLPDDVVFSQFSGLNEDNSRVLFNLKPHLKALKESMRENTELQVLHAGISDDDADDFLAYIKAFKNHFLRYFDRLHQGFDTPKMVD